MRTLSDFNFKNKTVLVRADLNSDVVKGKVIDGKRIIAASETIKELKRKKAKVVILAHQGNPGKYDFTSLEQHSKLLNKYTKIKFVKEITGKKAKDEINHLKPGEALLLENVRMEKQEFHPGKNKLVKFFLPLIEIYINDAFSVCHRDHTSIVSFPGYFESGIGRLMQRELSALKKVKLKNCLFILGGSKPEENILLLGKNKVLACGIFGQLCLISRGENLGKNNEKENRRFIKEYDLALMKLKNKLRTKKNLLVPEDLAVKIKDKRVEFPLEKFPTDYVIYDIGSRTIKQYVKEIKKARCIFMKGPAGFCGYDNFCKGTFAILKAIANSRAFSIIGGGHLNDAIHQSGISSKKFSHISLSGGALLRYIAGKRLPGLESLKQ